MAFDIRVDRESQTQVLRATSKLKNTEIPFVLTKITHKQWTFIKHLLCVPGTLVRVLPGIFFFLITRNLQRLNTGRECAVLITVTFL